MDHKKLGRHIAGCRKRMSVGLRELSRKAEISPASLSAIENGQSSPTLATLQKVLKALGTDFAEFFADTDAPPESPVFPTDNMRSIEDGHRKYTLLFPNRDDLKFEMISEIISPTEKDSEWEVHNFDMGGVVLEGGPLRIEIEEQGSWEIGSGDAFYIKAGQRHRAINLGDKPVKQITVAHPPRY